MSIPKIIHYCWFGRKPMPAECRKILSSWHKHFPDYRIIRWDEHNFDVMAPEYVKDAYIAGKYAFVSDYVRLYALKTYGGIYLDVDLEILRNFDNLLEGRQAVFGFESDDMVMTALMAAQPDNPIITEFLESYHCCKFDAANLVPNTAKLTELLRRRGLAITNQTQTLGDNTIVYALDYFQCYDFASAKLRITHRTCAIHRCFGSWCSPKERMIFTLKHFLGNLLSEDHYRRLKRIKKRIAGD